MEVKKKFEKPQMEVVQLKPANMVCGTGCSCDDYCGDDNMCWEHGECPLNDCTFE